MKKKLAAVLAILLAMVVAVPAYGAVFVPSIGQKTSPEVHQQKNKDGKTVDFLIYDEAGNEIVPGKWTDSGKEFYDEDNNSYVLVITSINDKDKTTIAAIKESLEKAYAEINGVKTLDQLSADVTKYLPSGMKLEDLAVGNLFNVSLLKNGTELVGLDAIGAASIDVQFDVSDVIMALISSGEGWKVLNVNGSNITIKLTKLSSNIAVVTKATQGGGTSPQTGYENNTGMVVAIAVAAAVAATLGVCLIVSKKRAK